MNKKYRDLWKKIRRFQMDDPKASNTFSDKLAHEQKWSKTFTDQAILEYKRFIFLCVVLPQGASPSKIVDEVWHLHLTYTKSYWIDFCKNTLGKEVHHHPSSGGKEQQAKHQVWYEDTLLQYTKWFGAPPPEAIWPHTGTIVSEPLVAPKITWIMYVATVMLPFLIGLVFYQQWNVFALAGPQFLGFYVYAALGALILHNWYRNKLTKLRQQYLEPMIPAYLNSYQIAYFLNDRAHAVNAAIVNLVDWGKLQVQGKEHYIVQNDPSNPSVEYLSNPVLNLLRLKKPGDVVMHWKLDKDLEYGNGFGSELYTMAIFKLKPITYLPCFWIILLGIVRCIQGVYNDKPIGFLFMLMVVLSLILWGINYLKDLSFKDWLQDQVRARYEKQWKIEPSLAQKFSLFGDKVLVGLPMVFLVARQFMEMPMKGGVGDGGPDGSSCGSSDGGGSDGGGSSCGGCGGCGGGD